MSGEVKHILFIPRSDHHHNPGGDYVQLKSTADSWAKTVGEATVYTKGQRLNIEHVDVIQLYNIGRPQELIPWLSKGKPVALFSIWVDFYGVDTKSSHHFKRSLARVLGKFRWEYVKVIARWLVGQSTFPGWFYLIKGHKASMQYVLNNIDVLMASTKHELDRLQTYFQLPENVEVLPLGVSDVFFQQKTKRGDHIVFGGYIEPRKGVKQLVEICTRRSWPLHVYGSASAQNKDYEKECKAQAGDTVRFFGRVSQNDYAQALANASVVVLPSQFETTGLAALEGAVMGKPIVVGEGGDTKEVYGKYAIYVDADNIESLESAIEQALSLGPASDQMDYFAKHSMRHHIEGLKSIYESII